MVHHPPRLCVTVTVNNNNSNNREVRMNTSPDVFSLRARSKRLCGAHYAEDITVTMRLLGEDLILVYDQIFKFDDRGVLYSWNAGGNRGVRETNFFDVYTALVEREGETCEEVGYLADL